MLRSLTGPHFKQNQVYIYAIDESSGLLNDACIRHGLQEHAQKRGALVLSLCQQAHALVGGACVGL